MRVVALHPHSLGASTAPLLRSSRARHVVGLAGVLGYVLLWCLESGSWIVPGQVSLLWDESPPASLVQASCFHCTGRAMLVPLGLTLPGWDQRTGRFLPSFGKFGSFALRR